MNFRETESYLLSLGNEVSAMKLGLENIRKLLTALGDPQTEFLKVQVAGTNGKGSVCAFLDSIFVQAGIRTGVFTSPHLISITERVRIGGVDISEMDFARLATRVRETADRLVVSGELDGVPTFFEQVTAIALLAFAEASVEVAILETGLGGRLDATTAANAEIAAITRIDLDHQQYLGETIEEIAAEKAAIIHEGSQVVVGEQTPEAMKVILDRCRACRIEPRFASEALAIDGRNPTGREGVRDGVAAETSSQLLGLAGRHQNENAAVAVAVTEVLREHFVVSNEQVVDGLGSARHPGRLEWIGRYLLDGAHNAGGAKALADYLDEFVRRPVTMIFGAVNDKDVKEIGRILIPRAHRLIATRVDNSRALSTSAILDAVPEGFDRTGVVVTNSVEEAMRKADQVSEDDAVIVVTGSLYLVGEARRFLIDHSYKLKTER